MARAHYDIVIVGTGMGGGTLARALGGSGARVLVLERGGFLPREPQNWSPEALFVENRYKARERWLDEAGGEFAPGVHYWVGGNTKVYGAALPRLRREDFGEIRHAGGLSPAWPVTYDDFEPWYAEAERLLWVHGEAGADPTDPPRTTPFPFPAMPPDPYMADLADRLRAQGLHPAPLPVGLDYREGGRCIRCMTCDAFPCMVGAKADAEVCGVRPALAAGGVELWTGALATRVRTDATGRRAVAVEVVRDGAAETVGADLVAVCAGAANTAALLLRSASDRHPRGLANGSDLVGRNWMVHNNTVLVAVDPARRNPTVFQKTITLNDWYHADPGREFPHPMGNLQPVGKLQAAMLAGAAPMVPRPLLGTVAARSVDWWVMSEDLPDPANRVTLAADGRVRVHWRPNNVAAHQQLLAHAKRALRRAGYPILLSQTMGIGTNSHQCGTARFGTDSDRSVLDPFGKAHELDNLYVVDASFFPSSTAVNPALTIAAQALRAAARIRGSA